MSLDGGPVGASFKVGIFMVQTFLVAGCGCGGLEIIGLLCIWGVVYVFGIVSVDSCGPEMIGLLCD